MRFVRFRAFAGSRFLHFMPFFMPFVFLNVGLCDDETGCEENIERQYQRVIEFHTDRSQAPDICGRTA